MGLRCLMGTNRGANSDVHLTSSAGNTRTPTKGKPKRFGG